MFTSYEILTALEAMGAQTVEIKERFEIFDHPMAGVAMTRDNGKILCNVGPDDGSCDCELTPDEFNERFYITSGIFN